MPWRVYLIRALPRHAASLDAELVSLRIVHADPVLTILLDGTAPVPAAVGPKVWVHPKVYVEGQPIRNLIRAVTP